MAFLHERRSRSR